MFIETERIELPQNQWWDIKTELTRGDWKRLEQLKRQWYCVAPERVDAEGLLQNPTRGLMVDYAKMDLVALDDLILSLGTMAWSFDAPIQVDGKFNFCFVDDELPNSYSRLVLERMNELYAGDSERSKLEAQKKT